MNKQVDIFSLAWRKTTHSVPGKSKVPSQGFLLKTLSHNYLILIPQFARWLHLTIFIPIRPLTLKIMFMKCVMSMELAGSHAGAMLVYVITCYHMLYCGIMLCLP